ncbi:protein-L-isoaspartate O-methyltransferase, partial [Candidatus Woesearchaeota archaeon]|nr:protein-L-isoaspartate O-methyltransferase [Candidatus Woesearchaeota archaeon]
MSSKEALIEKHKRQGALKTPDVIRAFERVPREKFVAKDYQHYAYIDEPLPLFSGQTISQPYTVAIMTEALELSQSQKVLEIGTGSGYQAAIISEIIGPRGRLYTIERIPKLHEFATEN